MPLDPTVEGSEGSTMTHDKSAGDGPTAYDLLLLLRQEWVGSEGPLLRATLRELGEVPRAEYREALERVFATIFDGAELEKLFQLLIPVGDEAHLGTLTLAVQARREVLASIARVSAYNDAPHRTTEDTLVLIEEATQEGNEQNEEFDAMMRREFPGYVVIATGRLPERN